MRDGGHPGPSPARVEAGPGEWVFALPPGEPPPASALRAAVRRLSSQPGPVPAGPVAFVAAELPGTEYGRVLAHWHDGRLVVYCARGDLASGGAAAVTAVLSAAAPLASGITGIRFAAAGHDAMLAAAIHPAVCVAHPAGLTLAVCADLLTPALAAALTRLAAASAGILRGSAVSRPPGLCLL
jgi:hypothetical protein